MIGVRFKHLACSFPLNPFSYVYLTKMAGGTARYVPLRAPKNAASSSLSGNEWMLNLLELEQAITLKTKMLVCHPPLRLLPTPLNSPRRSSITRAPSPFSYTPIYHRSTNTLPTPSHNPLGKVFTTEELGSIGKLCISHNLILVADEVYEHLAYGSPFSRVATLDPAIAARTLTAVSLGKLFNATGWRVGFVIGPWELLRHVQAAHLVLAYSSSSPAQEAMAVGLKEAEGNGFWESNRQDIKMKVGRICDVLDELGLAVSPSFYVEQKRWSRRGVEQIARFSADQLLCDIVRRSGRRLLHLRQH